MMSALSTSDRPGIITPFLIRWIQSNGGRRGMALEDVQQNANQQVIDQVFP
jgi:hypothetical protein